MGHPAELFEVIVLMFMTFLACFGAEIFGLLSAPRLFCLPTGKRQHEKHGEQDSDRSYQLEIIHT